MISVLDYGVGNLGSIQNMLKRVESPCRVISKPEEVLEATKLILPGVGSFDHGMSAIQERGLEGVLKAVMCEKKIPTLGICLGMQLMMESSEEGVKSGLGIFKGLVKKFSVDDPDFKVPHMGWNTINIEKKNPFITCPDSRFYFVHSYYVQCEQSEDVLATCNHKIDFVAAIQKENIFAVQFHPEKSHRFGFDLFSRFKEI